MTGSSRAAYSMTTAGTRKPRSSTTRSWLLLAEVAQRDVPRRGRPRRRALGDVAEHGGRTGRAAAADSPQLHGREVLGLVEHDVTEARSAPHQVAQLVEQGHVGA